MNEEAEKYINNDLAITARAFDREDRQIFGYTIFKNITAFLVPRVSANGPSHGVEYISPDYQGGWSGGLGLTLYDTPSEYGLPHPDKSTGKGTGKFIPVITLRPSLKCGVTTTPDANYGEYYELTK